jgi:hypothetical protein
MINRGGVGLLPGHRITEASNRPTHLKPCCQTPWLSFIIVVSPPPPRPHCHNVLPHDHVAAAASLHEAAPTRLLLLPPPRASLAGASHASYRRGTAQPLIGGRAAAYPLLSSFSTMTAQLDPTCSAPSARLLGFAEGACCKCMLQAFQMF